MSLLNTPLDSEKILKLKSGDEVFIDGRMYVMRDATLRRIFEEGKRPPVDLKGQVVFFGAPSFRKTGDKYEFLSVGVTTGQRMEKYLPGLVHDYGVKAVIAKGELSEGVATVFRDNRSVYLLFVGGAAALATSAIVEVTRVWWEDLLGEALFETTVKRLGPSLVAIDSSGNDLLTKNKKIVQERLKAILGE